VEKADLILVGVGGQGILTASDILSEVGLRAGYDVKNSEAHGMAQRGGAVISHVRLGETVCAPLIGRGEADYLLAFEMLEALRWVHFLHAEGVVLLNRQRIPPVSVTSGGAHYPEEVEVHQELAGRSRRVVCVEGLKIAQELGDVRVTNTALLGALSALLPIAPALWEEVILEQVPARYAELNREAFRQGRAQTGVN
jgi:indolepyruvate ferredoxin oxidoreductase beta subunit